MRQCPICNRQIKDILLQLWDLLVALPTSIAATISKLDGEWLEKANTSLIACDVERDVFETARQLEFDGFTMWNVVEFSRRLHILQNNLAAFQIIADLPPPPQQPPRGKGELTIRLRHLQALPPSYE
eukprot:1394280-Rhodomonas_salina.2